MACTYHVSDIVPRAIANSDSANTCWHQGWLFGNKVSIKSCSLPRKLSWLDGVEQGGTKRWSAEATLHENLSFGRKSWPPTYAVLSRNQLCRELRALIVWFSWPPTYTVLSRNRLLIVNPMIVGDNFPCELNLLYIIFHLATIFLQYCAFLSKKWVKIFIKIVNCHSQHNNRGEWLFLCLNNHHRQHSFSFQSKQITYVLCKIAHGRFT